MACLLPDGTKPLAKPMRQGSRILVLVMTAWKIFHRSVVLINVIVHSYVICLMCDTELDWTFSFQTDDNEKPKTSEALTAKFTDGMIYYDMCEW